MLAVGSVEIAAVGSAEHFADKNAITMNAIHLCNELDCIFENKCKQLIYIIPFLSFESFI
jgi:hypothetical protein